jgi:hypothetical protein
MAVSLNTALGAFPITALAGTSYVPLAGGTMTGALTLPAGCCWHAFADVHGGGSDDRALNVAFNDEALATGATRGYIMVPSAAGVSTASRPTSRLGRRPIVLTRRTRKSALYRRRWVWTAALAMIELTSKLTPDTCEPPAREPRRHDQRARPSEPGNQAAGRRADGTARN